MRPTDYDFTYWTLQHRYLDGSTYLSDDEGWTPSNYDNVAAPALSAGHAWLGSHKNRPSVTGALTLEDGLRGLEAVRKFHQEYPPDPAASDPYSHVPKGGMRFHKPAEFRLVKVHVTQEIDPVEEFSVEDVETAVEQIISCARTRLTRVLPCQGSRCGWKITDETESLEAISRKAYDAGWRERNGKVLCPDCQFVLDAP